MDTTFSTRQLPLRGVGRLVLVALLLLALVLTILAVGARRQALPEPFGLARNGTFVTTHDGDVYSIDPTSSEPTVLIGGAPYDFSAVFSRDGTKLVFLRSEGRPSAEPGIAVTLTMYVANADGSDVRALTPATLNLDWFDWSPDGTRIAYVTDKQLWVVTVATGERHRLVGTGPVHFPTWLPPGGDEIVFRSETLSPAIWAIPADGSGKRRTLSKQPASNEYDYQGIAVAPDGRRIAFTRWSSNGRPRVHAIDVASGTEITYPTTGGGQRGAAYSPDGSQIAYARWGPGMDVQLAVANADGSGGERVIGPVVPATPDGAAEPTWAFTPDGTALVVRFGNDDSGTGHLIPLDGSPTRVLDTGGFEFIDVQRLAP
jgi:Tol biopolymer transport system component